MAPASPDSAPAGMAALLSRRVVGALVWVLLAGAFAGVAAFAWQSHRNQLDASDRFGALSRRVTQGIVERMRRYEYGLRGARGVVVAADGIVTRKAFARYAASRQIDKEFPGARGFGVILRVPAEDEAAFVRDRRREIPDFGIRTVTPHTGDRFVIAYVEPIERNREAIGLDVASEPARRDAALRAAATGESTLTAPITLVQASGKRSGGLLLLLPIRRSEDGPHAEGAPAPTLLGWSYVPLLIEDVLRGLDAEDEHFALSLRDLDHDAAHAFYTTGAAAALDADVAPYSVDIPLYGRRWAAQLQATESFVQSLHQPSPLGEGIKAALLGGFFAALLTMAAQLVDRTRGQRLEQARRAAIVEGSSDAIVVQTLDGTITDWNDGAARLFGFTREEACGLTATALLLPPELAAEDASIRATVAGGGRVQVFETLRRARDGTLIPVSITASPIRDDAGLVVGAAKILRDVREFKAAEQRMRELNASLEDQVRERTALLDDAMREARDANAAKSRFLANISHEIRTPMNAVIGLSHMLERTRLDEDQAGMLTRIRTAGKVLMALLNDVLDLSKIEAGEMSIEAAPFRLEDVIAEVSDIVSVSAQQRGIGFRVTTRGDAPGPLIGDSTRLAQILLNLLSNAIKFTPAGQVELDIELQPADPAGRLPVRLRVSDTGIGIAREVQARLFQPFVQADASTTRRFGGTGLGLSIVHQLVQLLGGRIELQSEAGQGSVFLVELAFPLAAAQACPAAPARLAATGLPALSGVRILVVDDNALNREVADRILRSEGALVVLAANGRQALDQIARDDTIQVVLMDVQMPVIDGLEATRRLRALPASRRLPVIGLTAGVSADERRLAREAGMDDVIGKPFDPAALVLAISRQLGRDATNQEASHAAPPTVPDDWPDLPGIDRQAAFRRLKGDRPLLGRMLQGLVELLALNRALDGSTPTQALHAHAAVLHDLKALAGTLGAAALQAAAGQAEKLLRDQRWAEALEAMRQVDQQGLPLCLDLPQPAPARDEVQPCGPLDDGELVQLLGELRNFDLAALPRCERLAAPLRDAWGEAPARELLERVQSLRFDAAVEWIEQRRALA